MKATRENVEKLVEVLADKTSKPLTQGEIQKITLVGREVEPWLVECLKMDDLWVYMEGNPNCTLQEIIKDSGWMQVSDQFDNESTVEYETLKSPEARALFDYLLSIIELPKEEE